MPGVGALPQPDAGAVLQPDVGAIPQPDVGAVPQPEIVGLYLSPTPGIGNISAPKDCPSYCKPLRAVSISHRYRAVSIAQSDCNKSQMLLQAPTGCKHCPIGLQ